MKHVNGKLNQNGNEPIVYHWSQAEVSTLNSAYNAATKRHPEKNWPDPNWFDLLQDVMRSEPVVVRGCFGFGLKSVAKAMLEHGYIDSRWEDGPTDGLGAMVGAWWCDDAAHADEANLMDYDLMQEIVQYNEVDCRVMMEIIRYLRTNH